MTLKEGEEIITVLPGAGGKLLVINEDRKIVERYPVVGFAVTNRGRVYPLTTAGIEVCSAYEEDGSFYALLHPTGEVEITVTTPGIYQSLAEFEAWLAEL